MHQRRRLECSCTPSRRRSRLGQRFPCSLETRALCLGPVAGSNSGYETTKDSRNHGRRVSRRSQRLAWPTAATGGRQRDALVLRPVDPTCMRRLPQNHYHRQRRAHCPGCRSGWDHSDEVTHCPFHLSLQGVYSPSVRSALGGLCRRIKKKCDRRSADHT